MLLLLGILKRNNKYYMNVINTDKTSVMEDYQFINQFILNNCANVRTNNFLSSRQNPKEYLRGDFDVSRLIVDDRELKSRIREFQVIEIYYNDKNEPVFYKSVDRAGVVSIHDISEFEYRKNSSILGTDINNLPDFVERKSVDDLYEYLKNNSLGQSITELPVGLAKAYLTSVKGFKEGYHTVTRINNGVSFEVHEYLLFNGITTVKLIEYVAKDKNVFMTKQDEIANPYPKERTVEFLSGPFVVFGSKRALPKFCKSKDNTEFELYNGHAVKFNIPLNDAGIALYDKRIKSKELLSKWQLGFSGNLSLDIYKNILPNELFKMPRIFYHDMRNVPYANISSNIKYENVVVDVWIYTVALFVCWQFFSEPLKKALKPIMRNYAAMYANALEALVEEVGPKSAFTVMEWTKKNLSRRLGLIYNSDISCVLDAECLFHFYQNEYDLPEELLIYSIDAINEFGGYERLEEEYLKANSQRKIYIVNCLEKIERALQVKRNLKSDDGVKSVAKKLK